MRTPAFARLTLCALLACAGACPLARPPASAPPDPAALARVEREQAMALFKENLRAIQARDREAYLACYRRSEGLVRNGAEGVALGFEGLAEGTPATGSDDWPESLKAEQLQVQWLAPGLVYGSYRYVVTIDGETSSGISERVFLKEDGRWVIAVTTAFEVPSEAAGP